MMKDLTPEEVEEFYILLKSKDNIKDLKTKDRFLKLLFERSQPLLAILFAVTPELGKPKSTYEPFRTRVTNYIRKLEPEQFEKLINEISENIATIKG